MIVERSETTRLMIQNSMIINVIKCKNIGLDMVLLQYGLPQVSSICFKAEEVGWMAD